MTSARTGVRWAWLWWMVSAALWGQQYRADKAGPPPGELAPPIARSLGQTGFQITIDRMPYCEIWLRASFPPQAPSKEENVTLPNIAVGTLLGVIRFDGNGRDRRGQIIRPGVYTLRYGIMPANEAHQGAAPQRDFLLLIPAAEDRDIDAIPNFDQLVALSRKASGSAHPAVLSVWRAPADSTGFSEQGDSDWVLESKVGDTPIEIIVAGTADS